MVGLFRGIKRSTNYIRLQILYRKRNGLEREIESFTRDMVPDRVDRMMGYSYDPELRRRLQSLQGEYGELSDRICELEKTFKRKMKLFS